MLYCSERKLLHCLCVTAIYSPFELCLLHCLPKEGNHLLPYLHWFVCFRLSSASKSEMKRQFMRQRPLYQERKK